jgi:hypothetical protein
VWGSTPAASNDTVAAASAIDVLGAGTAFIDHTSFRLGVSIAGGQVATVAHRDTANKRADATLLANGTVTDIRLIGSDIYMRTTTIKLPGVGDSWMILDPAKVPAAFPLSFAPGMKDPGGSARLINAIVSAQVSGTAVTGTIDVTRIGTGNGIWFRPGPDGKFPDGAQNHEFHATLDNEGRLFMFVIPNANGLPDAALPYTHPPGAAPAPDALYPQLGLHQRSVGSAPSDRPCRTRGLGPARPVSSLQSSSLGQDGGDGARPAGRGRGRPAS